MYRYREERVVVDLVVLLASTVAIATEMFFCDDITSRVIDFLENLRMEIEGPSIASGGMMMLTRLPSSSRASHNGDDSSIRRPIRVTMRVAMF